MKKTVKQAKPGPVAPAHQPMVFKLVEKEQLRLRIGAKLHAVEALTYECAETGAKVQMAMNPARAWSFLYLPGTNEVGDKFAGKLVEAYCEAGLEQSDKKPFDECVASLTI
jgi:hypothetical protein